MLSVSVHKDIGEYTEKVVGKLSARTLACTAGGLASSVAAAAVSNLAFGVPVDAATLPVMAASMPFWLMGFWRPKGLPAEKFLPLLADHLLEDGKLVYATGSAPASVAGSVACRKAGRRARRASKRKGAERRGPKPE
ncbi:PrgI family protein [Gordonibacter sp. RACS_AR49]|uniref:PrgI family protein n=1 Tax=Gordonibacter sp. RACS_AR49 TaxID=2871986 RepID=UPI0026236C1C|nr:PrgI family protein [Gordonibacter sp. RACS_AR49]MDN4508592.1 PrgI family protein [Gordonibacter sp. RACS_AR49]